MTVILIKMRNEQAEGRCSHLGVVFFYLNPSRSCFMLKIQLGYHQLCSVASAEGPIVNSSVMAGRLMVNNCHHLVETSNYTHLDVIIPLRVSSVMSKAK